MKKVSLLGERSELKKVIDTLKETGDFQITFYKSTGNDLNPTDQTTKQNLQAEISSLSNLLNYLNVDNKTLTMSYQELKNVTKKSEKIKHLVTQLDTVRGQIATWQTQIAHHTETINLLTPFTALPIKASLLHHTRSTFVLAGLMTAANFTRFQNDLDLKDFLTETYPAPHGQIAVVLTGEKEQLPIANTIFDYEFNAFPDNQDFDRTPQAQIDYLLTQNQTLQEQIAALAAKHQPQTADINLLKTYYDYLLNELDTLEILTATIQTKACFLVHGWIPENRTEQFTQIIHRTSKNIVVEMKDATTTDTPPVAVLNSRLVAPYSSITAMYGAPGRNDIDPNPFVAFFYFLFFGMMFGDVAYGLLLSVITGFILIKKKPQGGMQQMMALFFMGGISAVIWGLVFNGFLGISFLPKTLIDPIFGKSDAVLFFALSLYMGVLQILVGTLLNIINLIRLKQYRDAGLKALPHFIFFIGLTLSFPALISFLIPQLKTYAFINWCAPLMLPGVIILLVGFAGMVLFNGLGRGIGGYFIGMFSGAYKLINYFSDILSYARLFGVGLVGCVIGYVANYLFSMFASLGLIGVVLGLIVLVIFHAINIALGLLSTYIHNARLQFVEFFGKFYEGSGTVFTPLGSKLRYTRIQGNTGI